MRNVAKLEVESEQIERKIINLTPTDLDEVLSKIIKKKKRRNSVITKKILTDPQSSKRVSKREMHNRIGKQFSQENNALMPISEELDAEYEMSDYSKVIEIPKNTEIPTSEGESNNNLNNYSESKNAESDENNNQIFDKNNIFILNLKFIVINIIILDCNYYWTIFCN